MTQGKRRILPVWLGASLGLAMSVATQAQADLRYPLTAGVYRFDGRCVEFRDSISDHLAFCSNSLGIITATPELPEFYFMTADGKAWVFPTKKLKKVANDGRHAEFTIVNFMELATGTVYKFSGDCTLDLDQSNLRVACQARVGKKIVRNAVFESAGTFVFSRGETAQGGDGKKSQ